MGRYTPASDRFAASHALYSPYDADEIYCSYCGECIPRGAEFYNVNGEYYCMDCQEIADDAILNNVRDGYITENYL